MSMKKKIDTSRHLRFTGSFSALKKEGFKFQKLYARNYMQWCFDNGEEFGYEHISVWKHLGGYVEIIDLYGLSKYVARLICTPDALEATGLHRSLMGKSWTTYEFVIDRQSGEIVPFNKDLHDSMWIFYDRLQECKGKEEETEALHNEISVWHSDFEKKFRKFMIAGDSWLIPKIRDMYAKGMIDPFC